MFLFPKKRSTFLNSVKLGEVYAAKIEELIENGEAIINFRGNLVKVKNLSSLTKGEFVTVKVTKTKPDLVFEIVNNAKKISASSSRFEICG